MSKEDIEINFDLDYDYLESNLEDFSNRFKDIFNIDHFGIDRVNTKNYRSFKDAFSFVFNYHSVRVGFVLFKSNKLSKISMDYTTDLEKWNEFLEVIDIFVDILKPKAIYKYLDAESLEEIYNSDSKPNKINYWSEKRKDYFAYHYKLGEKNKIVE